MNLRALSNFLSVAEIGSLKGAAGVVHIAQPALTRQIALLEEEFGTKLFLRHHRGVTLTEAGERLREHAERVLAEVSRTHLAMSAAAQKPTGTVSLGLPTAIRHVLSSTVISSYHVAFPNVQLNVHEAFVHILEDMMQGRQVDVAILFSSSRKLDDFEVTPLATESVYLVGPAGCGLELDRPVTAKMLAKVPIILISRRNQLRLTAEQAMARHGLEFQPFLEIEGQPLTMDLVKNGVGYTITPYCAVQAELETGILSGAPISGMNIGWALAVNRARAHAPAVSELNNLIRTTVGQLIARGIWHGAEAATRHSLAAVKSVGKRNRSKAKGRPTRRQTA